MTSTAGWYGSDPAKNVALAAIADGLGTFFLVLSGISSAVLVKIYMPQASAVTGNLIVALGFGAVLAVLIAALGQTSGAHFNPAVTIGQCVARNFNVVYGLFYVVAQAFGAYFAVRLVKTWYGPQSQLADLGAPALKPGLSIAGGMLVEGIFTFLLVFVVITVATSTEVKGDPGLSIGLALFMAVFLGGALTGGAVNPTRALVTIVESGNWELGRALWVYTVAPILGGVLASLAAKALQPVAEPSA